MLEINLKKLIKNYDQNLLDNLRGFGKDDEFLKFWVPGTNDYQSFLNLIDALVESKIYHVKIIIELNINEKEIIEKTETFLLKISSFKKDVKKDSIHLNIKIDEIRYKNYLTNKRNQTNEVKKLKLDNTKHLSTHKINELIKPLYKKNLDFFSPINFFSNLNDININKDTFVQKIGDIKMVFNIKNQIIDKVFHDIEKETDLKKLINIFFELILKKNIQEAADHGVIYLEEKIRLSNNKLISKGIILPVQAGSYFMSINNAIRNVFSEYKIRNKLEFDINKNYSEISPEWKKLTKEEKFDRINLVLKEICRNNNLLSQESVSINKIENNFKVYLNVDNDFKKLQQDKNVLLEIEIKLKKIEDTLEIFVDEILDQNKLRLKNSPQSI